MQLTVEEKIMDKEVTFRELQAIEDIEEKTNINYQPCELGQLIQHLDFKILPPTSKNDQLQGLYKEVNSNQQSARKKCRTKKERSKQNQFKNIPYKKSQPKLSRLKQKLIQKSL